MWTFFSSKVPACAANCLKEIRGGKVVGGMGRTVRTMSVGPTHATFVCEDGELFCLGSNHYGECGADPAAHGTASPCRCLRFPPHTTPIAFAKCGKSHTVAIGSSGQGFAWGDDSRIQLGLGDTRSNVGDERPWTGSRGFQKFLNTGESMAPSGALRGGPDSPSFGRAPATSAMRYGEFQAHFQWRPSPMMEIPLEFERQVHGIPYPAPDGVECGDDFTILVVRDSPDWFPAEEESNRLFCCGENGKGQCGRSMQSSQQTLAATKLPKCTKTLGVSCGSAHCLALLQRIGVHKRELWVWGSNDHGQVGGSKAGAVCPPVRLRLPREVRMEATWCGFANSAVICSERQSRKARTSPEKEINL